MAKQWLGVSVGVVLGAGLAAWAVLSLSRNDEAKADSVPKKAPATSEPETLTIGTGMRLELLLLTPLHSGDAKVGERATVVVASDVKDRAGNVLIAAGTTTEAEVVRSREASVMSQLVNQPARLAIKLLPISVGGVRVKLAADAEDPEAPFELTRDTAGRDEASAALKALWDHTETQGYLIRLADRMNGESTDRLDDPDSRRIMRDVADQLGLTATSDALARDGQSIGAMLVATEKVSRGQYGDMNTAETLLAFQAVAELAHVANGIDRGLRGKIKGRNIKVPIGTKLTGYVAETVTIVR